MKLIYINGNNIPAHIIKLLTFSKWSHVGVCLDDNTVVDTTLFNGVKKWPMDTFLKRYPRYEYVEVHLPDSEAAKQFLENQIGKGYDWKAVLGFLFRRKWNIEDSWFCSELAEATCSRGGRQRFRDEVHRITPHQSWSVL